MVCRSESTVATRFWLPAVALPAGARQHGLGPGLKGTGKVGPHLRVRTVLGRRFRGPCLTEEFAAHASFGWGPVLPVGCRLWWTACSAPRLQPVAGAVTLHDVLRMLAVIWLHPTRLETRTKESTICASLWVIETRGRNESEGGFGLPR